MRISPDCACIAPMVLLVVALSAGAFGIAPAAAEASNQVPRTGDTVTDDDNSDVFIAVGSLQVAGVIVFETVTRKRRRSCSRTEPPR